MHTLSLLLVFLTLCLTGIYAGMCVMCQIGVLPAMRLLSLQAYVEAWRAMDFYLDRSMPPFKVTLLAASLGATVVLAMQHRNHLAACLGLTFVCSLVALVLTITMQLPLNRKLQTLPPDTSADTLLAIREHTVHNFAVRLVLAIAAFIIPCAGVLIWPVS